MSKSTIHRYFGSGRRFCLLSGAALLGASGQAFAQEATALPDIDIDSEVVQGETAAGAQRIDRSDLRARQSSSSDTAKLLQSVPGVSGFSAGGFSTLPVIRGLESQRLGVTVDVNRRRIMTPDRRPTLTPR